MASNTPNTTWVVASLARLTGEAGKPVRHGRIFKVVVTSSDDVQCGVPIRIDTHPKVVRPYALNQIADSLRLERVAIMGVLDSWTHAQPVAHLNDARAAREAAQRLAEMIRRRSIPVDVQAADEVKHHGLIAD